MNKKIILYVSAWILVFIILNILALAFTYYVDYPMTLKNCAEVLKADYLTPTDDYAQCVKIIAYPFYNYWLTVFILVPLLIGLFLSIPASIVTFILMDSYWFDEVVE